MMKATLNEVAQVMVNVVQGHALNYWSLGLELKT